MVQSFGGGGSRWSPNPYINGGRTIDEKKPLFTIFDVH
jgi:hypothetical protein